MYGTTYIVRSFIEPSNKRPNRLLRFVGSHPVVGRPGVFAIARADEGDFLGSRYVAGIAAMQDSNSDTSCH